MLKVTMDTDSILTVINKPKDCLLLVAFSLTEDGFLKDLEKDSSKDYAKLVARHYKLLPHYLWAHHHLPLVNTIRQVAAAAGDFKATVKLNTTLEDLHDLSQYKIVTIVAHYNDERGEVELSDKLHAIDEFVANTDDNFDGVFDLSVCNSTILQDKLKEKFGDKCFVKANTGLAEIKIHLILYKNVIEMLDKFETNYLTAMLKLRSQLNAYIKNKM